MNSLYRLRFVIRPKRETPHYSLIVFHFPFLKRKYPTIENVDSKINNEQSASIAIVLTENEKIILK